MTGDYRLSSVLDRYTASPHLATYIRHLCIYDKYSGRGWNGVSTELPLILDMYRNVTKLSLQVWERDPPRPPWLRSDGLLVSPSTRRLEKGLLFTSLRSVRTITISEYSVLHDTALPEVLNGFPQLQTLVILYLRGGTVSYDTSPNPSFNLKVLRLEDCTDIGFLRWLSPALACLNHLSVARETAFQMFCVIRPQEAGAVDEKFGDWMKSIGHSITHLTIDASMHDDSKHFNDVFSNVYLYN